MYGSLHLKTDDFNEHLNIIYASIIFIPSDSVLEIDIETEKKSYLLQGEHSVNASVSIYISRDVSGTHSFAEAIRFLETQNGEAAIGFVHQSEISDIQKVRLQVDDDYIDLHFKCTASDIYLGSTGTSQAWIDMRIPKLDKEPDQACTR